MAMRNEKSYEADNRSGINHEGKYANTPVRRLTSTSIVGDKIENPEGEDLGKIDNLMINLNTGMVEYAVIEFGSFLGIGGKLFAVPFSELTVDPDKEIFILNRDKEYLKDSPGFDSSHWPETNDHDYYDNVNRYWEVPVGSGTGTTSTYY
jgi:sporulation protein YlmC with PRC-barrel domain